MNETTKSKNEALLAIAMFEDLVLGIHRHRCDHCGTVWAHDHLKAKELSKELAKKYALEGKPFEAVEADVGKFFDLAHTCPQCGKEQVNKYFGPETPNATGFTCCALAPRV